MGEFEEGESDGNGCEGDPKSSLQGSLLAGRHDGNSKRLAQLRVSYPKRFIHRFCMCVVSMVRGAVAGAVVTAFMADRLAASKTLRSP
jgi:hypothetical protein